MTNEIDSDHLNLFEIFDNKDIRIAAIFLNGPKELDGTYAELWHKAVWRTVVDGFANVLHSSPHRPQLRPNLITGDFDSIKKEAMTFYKEEMGVEVIVTPDPNFIDMEKAILKTQEKLAASGQQVDCIVVAGIAGGRCDHALANLHALRRAHSDHLPVYLLTEANVTCILSAGTHSLALSSSRLGTACGLVPLFEPAQVTTTGLKWNLDNQLMSMMGLISTSNKVESSPVTVQTDKALLFTCEYI